MSNDAKIAFILGTRPEIIKLAPLIVLCQKAKNRNFIVIHTNQHYSQMMDAVFFAELGLPPPTHHLNVGSGTQAEQLAKMMVGLEKVLIAEMPDVIVVQGDTNTVFAGAFIASRLGIKIAHVEAGLRSYDRTMPEELNRILTDHMSDFLFAPTMTQAKVLLKEGVDRAKVFTVGNTIVDAVLQYRSLAKKNSKILELHRLVPHRYFLLTCHRPSNTDNEAHFIAILSAVSQLAQFEGVPCIFPVHPRNSSKQEMIKSYPNIVPIEPVCYLDLLQLQQQSLMIFTDSGGIQEEACILEKKCVILRTNTERPETVKVGGAVLIREVSVVAITKAYQAVSKRQVSWVNPFGDGKASARILAVIKNK